MLQEETLLVCGGGSGLLAAMIVDLLIERPRLYIFATVVTALALLSLFLPLSVTVQRSADVMIVVLFALIGFVLFLKLKPVLVKLISKWLDQNGR
jgi:hypothetical protein